MAKRRNRRQAVTPTGVIRRLLDAQLCEVVDDRDPQRVKFPLRMILAVGIVSMLTRARSQRAVENRTEQLTGELRAVVGLGEDERISDNAFGRVLPRVSQLLLRHALRRQARAEYDRGGLRAERLKRNTVAIDGKHVATISERELRRLCEVDPDDPYEVLQAAVRRRFPRVQLQRQKDGHICGLLRVHRATLVSSEAAVVVDQQPILGKSNEIGTICQTLDELFGAWGRTNLVEMVVADAGNTSLAAADRIVQGRADYLLRVTDAQGDLFAEAERTLAGRADNEASLRTSYQRDGKMVCYSLWKQALPAGHLHWGHARQLIRIERVTADDEGRTTVGNRYFVCSLDDEQMPSGELLDTARAYWRCENEGHWTQDAVWREDARRTPWTRHPAGIIVTSLLRCIALNIAAVLRAQCVMDPNNPSLRPTWRKVAEYLLLLVCAPASLDTTEFDAVEV